MIVFIAVLAIDGTLRRRNAKYRRDEQGEVDLIYAHERYYRR